MAYYLTINRLNGRNDFKDLAQRLDNCGYNEHTVRYHAGGWVDNMQSTAAPHLMFENEEDALMYSLAYGGTLSATVPEQK